MNKSFAGLVEVGLDRNIPERGKKNINRAAAIVAGAAAVTGTVVGFNALRHSNEAFTRPDGDQIIKNEQVIVNAKEFTGDVTLKGGVRMRISPYTLNGDNSTGDMPNIALTVPNGKTLHANSAIELGNGWIALERPSGDSHATKSTKKMAEELVYVNAQALEANDADKISIDGTFNTSYVDQGGSTKQYEQGDGPIASQLIASEYLKPVVE